MLSAAAIKGVGAAAVKIRKHPHPRAAQSRTVPSMLALTNSMAAEHSGIPRCTADTAPSQLNSTSNGPLYTASVRTWKE